VVLVGPDTPQRRALAKWTQYAGAAPVAAEAPEEAKRVCGEKTDVVVVSSGAAPAPTVGELAEACRSGQVFLLWPLGTKKPAEATGGRFRYLSDPLTPSSFMKVLTGEHPAGDESPGNGPAGNVGAGQQEGGGNGGAVGSRAAQELISRFPPESIQDADLSAIGEEARRLREQDPGPGSRVDELLFRIALAARRGDRVAVNELFVELRRTGEAG
jgi:hypothetical protein